jgi:hypothetical protein
MGESNLLTNMGSEDFETSDPQQKQFYKKIIARL